MTEIMKLVGKRRKHFQFFQKALFAAQSEEKFSVNADIFCCA
jgi:hypothetical protein